MAVYPNSVRAFTTHTDLSETVFALHMNDAQDEIVAIQTELGVLPKGTYGSVRLRLDALTTGKSDAGHDHTNRLDNPGHDVTTRHTFGSALGNPGTPTTWAVGNAAAVGTGAAPAHEDHQHAVPAQATVIDQVIPAGVIWEYGGTTLPAGNWLWCDGTSYLRTTPYDKLFTAIGTRYGAADGTHFNVPDMRSRFAMGGASTGAAVATGGSANAVLVSHQHPGSGVGNGSADHQHWVAHGHHVGGVGDHRHMDDLGYNYAFRHGPVGIDNDNLVSNAAANRSAGVTFTIHNWSGAHDHNTDTCDRGYSDGATNSGAYHGHGLTIALEGVSATNANLPPYVTVNFIIKY